MLCPSRLPANGAPDQPPPDWSWQGWQALPARPRGAPERSRDRRERGRLHRGFELLRGENPRWFTSRCSAADITIHGALLFRPRLKQGNNSTVTCVQAHKPAKNAAISRASNSGSSTGAKCPPLGIGVHRRTLYKRSAHSRGGVPSSTNELAKTAMPVGTLTNSCGATPAAACVNVIVAHHEEQFGYVLVRRETRRLCREAIEV